MQITSNFLNLAAMEPNTQGLIPYSTLSSPP